MPILLKPKSPRSKNTDQSLDPANRAALRQEMERVSRLLLIRLRSLGDSILTLPLIEALHNWRPDLKLDILIENRFAPIFSRHPAVHELLPLRQRDGAQSAGWTRARAISEIRRRRYPVVLNLHGGTTSLLFSLTSGARLRIAQESHRNSWAYNIRIPFSTQVWEREDLHTVEHQLTLMRWLNIPFAEPPRAKLHLEEEAREHLQQRLNRAGVSARGYIVIQPTATLFTKQWREENFARLADALCRCQNLPVIFTSAPSEIQVLRDIGKTASHRHHYWSDLRLDELFAVIEACRLFIGNDSGPTHAAAALNKPIVVVWGSSNFHVWHPWGTDYEAVRSNLPCMPCPGYACEAFGEPKCIREIPVARVFQACERLLARTETVELPS